MKYVIGTVAAIAAIGTAALLYVKYGADGETIEPAGDATATEAAEPNAELNI